MRACRGNRASAPRRLRGDRDIPRAPPRGFLQPISCGRFPEWTATVPPVVPPSLRSVVPWSAVAVSPPLAGHQTQVHPRVLNRPQAQRTAQTRYRVPRRSSDYRPQVRWQSPLSLSRVLHSSVTCSVAAVSPTAREKCRRDKRKRDRATNACASIARPLDAVAPVVLVAALRERRVAGFEAPPSYAVKPKLLDGYQVSITHKLPQV